MDGRVTTQTSSLSTKSNTTSNYSIKALDEVDREVVDEVLTLQDAELFLNNDPVAHLGEQIQRKLVWGNPLEGRKTVVSKEILFSNDAYYFE